MRQLTVGAGIVDVIVHFGLRHNEGRQEISMGTKTGSLTTEQSTVFARRTLQKLKKCIRSNTASNLSDYDSLLYLKMVQSDAATALK